MEYQLIKFLGYEIQIWKYPSGSISALATHSLSQKMINKSFRFLSIPEIIKEMKADILYFEGIKD